MGGADAVRAYVGLGSNLDDPIRQVTTALEALEGVHRTRVVGHSSLYRSPPLGPADQPDYINAVAALETGLAPRALLESLQAIERAHGRVREGVRWGPRTLDLDLLVYDERVLNEPELTLPHPGLHERAFVLYPLFELAPDLTVTGYGPISELVERCPRGGLERLEPE